MKSQLRILHLEDNVNDAELVKEILGTNNIDCEITCVQTREDFEELLNQEGWDLILSDYRLVAFDGISALALAQKKCPDVPYIFVSGNIGEDRAIETLKNGATDYILKDRLLRLVSSVERAIREVEMKKENRLLEEQFRQSQKMELVGRLAGGIAHDFNNMLTVITGYSDFLLENFKNEATLYKYLSEIRKAAEKSSTLTQQLLSFSRRQVLQPRVLDLNEAIASANQMLRRLIGESIDLVTIAAPELAKVKLDSSHLEQIILNLVVNARDAMPDEGGKITIEAKNVVVGEDFVFRHPTAATGRYVLLSVKDTGEGIEEKVKPRIFEPFFTTKAEGKGTGLGLATVFGIVKQSNGYIEVESQIGKGTEFKIFFPKAEHEFKKTETVKTMSAKQRGSETILLVEDEASVRTLTREILEMSGYHVLEAEGGSKAISVCEKYKGLIHLLLTDSVMPRMSGEDLSKKLFEVRPEMKVLIFSGYADHYLNQQRIVDSHVPFLQKPFTPEGLAQKVRETLEA